jgi:hypothetical protein
MQQKIQSKIPHASGATRDEGDLASSSLLLSGLSKKIVTLAAPRSKIQHSQKYNKKYGMRRGQRGTRETLPTPHYRRRAAIKLEKEHCLGQPQTYFAGGGEGGGEAAENGNGGRYNADEWRQDER